MRVIPRVFVFSLLLALVVSSAPAGEDDPLGDSYTEAELAALDRALHAVNMDRRDLTFKKDVTEGHACLDLVRKMLADPLRIAPEMDRMVAEARAVDDAFHAPLGALAVAHDLLPHTLPLATRVPEDPYGVLRTQLRRDVPPDSMSECRPATLLAWLTTIVSGGGYEIRVHPPEGAGDDAHIETLDASGPRYRALRRYLPEQMALHKVFDSPYPDDIDVKIVSEAEGYEDDWLHDLCGRIDLQSAVTAWFGAFGDPVAWLTALPAEAFPTDAPLVADTPFGRVALGTFGDDIYEGDYAALIDPGGNDRYIRCRIGAAYGTENRRVGFFADLGGDDRYECGDVDFTLGAAVLGIAAFFDLGAGDDLYQGGHASLGAAMGGVAVFYDDGGSDVYEGKTFTQGAAGFGVGIMVDDSVQPEPVTTSDEGTKDPVDIGLFDNDRYSAWSSAQAFARCRGVAICMNRRGNEVYQAGGVYLHAPLFADRYQSFSQGFAIGERGIDYAGGIALLVDHAGNDRYLGDIYNQGVGYWYAAGLLWDGGGNDTYEMTQYGQGSGIHLAVGGLIDVAGHDTYVMHSGLGQGGSHDYAASILHDRGGNDRYFGNTSCNGCGLTNAVGIHIDRSGDDVYAGRRAGGINSGRPARGFGSIGVLLDLGGQDDYLGIMKDDGAWRDTDVGVGLDLPAPEGAGDSASSAPDNLTGTAAIPEVCGYEGDLTEAVFDELWAIAIRWEVGDNRVIVPEARKRLAAFGTPVLDLMDGKVEQRASGLELRAFVDILQMLRDAGEEEPVLDFLRRHMENESERHRTVALYITGELKLEALGEEVVGLLASAHEGLARRAAGVLRAIGSHAGDEVLAAWLDPAGDERRLQVAIGTLVGLEASVWDRLVPLLDHPLMSVRTTLTTALAAHAAAYDEYLRAGLAGTDWPPRATRSLLDVFARASLPPRLEDVATVSSHFASTDFGLRADAARVLRHWLALEGVDSGVVGAAKFALRRLLETEVDPFVRFLAGD